MKVNKRNTMFLRKATVAVVVMGLTFQSLPVAAVSLANMGQEDMTDSSSVLGSTEEIQSSDSLNDLRDPLTSITSYDATSSELETTATTETTEPTEESDSQEVSSKAASFTARADGVALVTDWDSFAAALGDVTVTKISLQNDITLSGVLENVNGLFDKASVDADTGFVYLFVNKVASRTIVIDGSGHTFDFGNLAIGFNNQSLTSGNDWNITLQNVNVESNNYHAPFFYPRIAVGETTSGLNTRLKNQALVFGDKYQHTRYVTDYREYVTAMNTISVDKVEFIADIIAEGTVRLDVQVSNIDNAAEYPTSARTYTPSSGGQNFMRQYAKGAARTIYVEGNGFTWDQGSMVWCYHDPTTRDQSGTTGARIWDITFANMNTYHVNYWGIAEFWDLATKPEGDAKVTYHNFTNRGSQLIESQRSRVDFSGEIDVRQVETYSSVRKDGSPIRSWDTNNRRNQTVSVAATTIYPDSKVYLSSLAGTTLHLREAGDLVIGENAEVELIREGWNGQSSQEGEAAVIDVSKGNLIVKKGAVINATSKDPAYGTVIYTKENNALLQIDKAAVINAKVENYSRTETTSRNPIYMNGGRINVEGSLNLEGTGMGDSRTHMLYSPNAVNFTVARGGELNILSDSTYTEQALMYFKDRASVFKFSDAQRVNLQKTKAISADSNGLIYMGAGGVLNVSVQNVYQWKAGNLAGGETAEDGGMDFKYEPMSNMNLTYSGFGLGSKTGNSMFAATSESFRQNFTTQGQQRVLFEYVPAPTVDIQSIANDNPADPGSITIFGYARPNTYIRLWEEAKNGTRSSLVKGEEDTIATPIEDANFDANAVDGDGEPMYTDDPRDKYTVIADVNGDWKYTIAGKDVKHFTANNVIHAFGFNNLKSEEPTQIVLDKTAPTADPVRYYVVKGDPTPAADVFRKNYQDTNPVAAEAAEGSVSYNSATDILTLMQTESTEEEPHKVLVDVSDSAINPISGDPQPNTRTIEAELVVLNTPLTFDISGDELVIKYSDLRDMSDEGIKAWILDASGATAYKVDRGGKTDLTDKIKVTNLGGLTDISLIVAADGQMKTIITVSQADSGLAQDYHFEIPVKVIDLLSELKVEFVNENGDVMDGYTLSLTSKDGVDLVVGDKVDLTDEQYGVVAQLKKIAAAGYDLKERPAEETAFLLNDTEVTATYKFTGIVYLASAPANINFGTIAYDATVKQVDDGSRDHDLVVNDTRMTKSKWVLGAKISTQMTHDDDDSVKLIDSLQYFYGDDKVILNEGYQKIYQEDDSTATDTKITNISDSWGTTNTSDGIKLIVDPSKSKILKGSYTGVIEWQFMQDEPEN